MSVADKLSQLSEIRSDMREQLVAKGIDASEHGFADFPGDVEAIQVGEKDEWVRPAEWPQYTDEMIEDEVVYFTVDLKAHSMPKIALVVTTDGGFYVKRGQVIDGEFVSQGNTDEIASGKQTWYEFIDTSIYTDDYLVYQITPKTNSHITNLSIDGATHENYGFLISTGNGQTVLVQITEIFGNLPYFSGEITYYAFSGIMLTSIYLKNIHPSILRQNFARNSQLTNLQFINFSLTTSSLDSTFQELRLLKYINIGDWDIDTSTCTSMRSLFSQCTSLKSLDLSSFNTSSCTNMSSMFDGCLYLEELDVSNFDTSNCANMNNMFRGCLQLRDLNLSGFDTSACTSMINTFNNCTSLKSLDLSSFNMSAVTTVQNLFSCAALLKTIYWADGQSHTAHGKTWTASPVLASNAVTTGVFGFNPTLTNIYSFSALPASFNISDAKALTVDSLLVIFNALPTISTTQTLTLGSVLKAKLTAEQIAIAEEKGWTVA